MVVGGSKLRDSQGGICPRLGGVRPDREANLYAVEKGPLGQSSQRISDFMITASRRRAASGGSRSRYVDLSSSGVVWMLLADSIAHKQRNVDLRVYTSHSTLVTSTISYEVAYLRDGVLCNAMLLVLKR